MTVVFFVFLCQDWIPVSEGRASGEEDSFGFGLGLVKQTEKRVVFHTDLPKDFTLVSTGHHKLESVLMGALKTNMKRKTGKSHSETGLLHSGYEIWDMEIKQQTSNCCISEWSS